VKNKLNEQCLVLNRSWQAVGIVDVFRAICMVINERAKFVHQVEYRSVDFCEWITLDIKGVDKINTPSISFPMPELIVTENYNKVFRTGVSMTASNIFKRDGGKCWYCGSKSHLTIDHIIPRSKGGPHAWTNVITSCKHCNGAKDDRDAEEFCEKMGVEVPAPVNLKQNPWMIKATHGLHDSWKPFVGIR
jgi:5-methylcytosine-specific restriction endonuclease McrA